MKLPFFNRLPPNNTGLPVFNSKLPVAYLKETMRNTAAECIDSATPTFMRGVFVNLERPVIADLYPSSAVLKTLTDDNDRILRSATTYVDAELVPHTYGLQHKPDSDLVPGLVPKDYRLVAEVAAVDPINPLELWKDEFPERLGGFATYYAQPADVYHGDFRPRQIVHGITVNDTEPKSYFVDVDIHLISHPLPPELI